MKSSSLFLLAILVSPLFGRGDNSNTYLALGDSVPFGMNVTLVTPYSDASPAPSEFIGYPESVISIDRMFGMKTLVDASCPGETSGSFLNTSAPDNGCNSPHFQPPAPTVPPFKTTYGLHSNYTQAQMAYANSQLETNKKIKLVTLSIGANDILLAIPALESCGASVTCQQGVLGPILQTYAGNLATILTNIRARYSGSLLLMTYYTPSPALDSLTQALNGVMKQVGSQFPNVGIADGYTVFKVASAAFGNDACAAGLLIKLPPGPYTVTPCDIHPSPLGRSLLAAAVEFAMIGAR